jgi:hypothetical protein
VAAALTSTLLIVFAALVAKGDATGRAGERRHYLPEVVASRTR